MCGTKVAIGVLDFMQVFDQQISTARFGAKQGFDLIPRLIHQLTTFCVMTALTFAGFPNALPVFLIFVERHVLSPRSK